MRDLEKVVWEILNNLNSTELAKEIKDDLGKTRRRLAEEIKKI
jgi:hypothetical protein